MWRQRERGATPPGVLTVCCREGCALESFAVERIFALAALLLLASSLAARVSTSSVSSLHARTELIAEKDFIEPGQDSWVGLHFELESGWHIYWINPGDSGEPPRVQWHLPAGFQAGLSLGLPIVDCRIEDRNSKSVSARRCAFATFGFPVPSFERQSAIRASPFCLLPRAARGLDAYGRDKFNRFDRIPLLDLW